MAVKDVIITNPVKPLLDPLEAARKAQLGTSGTTSIQYSVSGNTNIPGSPLLLTPDLPANAMLANADKAAGKQMQDDIVKNSQRRQVADQVSMRSILTMLAQGVDNLTAAKSKTTNAGIIMYQVAEDVYYLDDRLYDAANSIDTSFYTATTDAQVVALTTAGKNYGNAKARRIAKLAKAFKDAVIAQTNDTNPFYLMRLSEIFDRLTDYFAFVDRAVTCIRTAEAWIKLRKLINDGDIAYKDTYNALYTADFEVTLVEILGRAKTSLLGTYMDKISLSEYLRNGVPGLTCKQNGATRVLVPILGVLPALQNAAWVAPAYLDGIGSHALLPHITSNNPNSIASQQAYIISLFDGIIQRAYSEDNSVIQTALSAFNGVDMLGDFKDIPLIVKQDVVDKINANLQYASGFITKRTSFHSGGVEVWMPSTTVTGSGSGTVGNPADPYHGYTNGIVFNFNGVASYAASYVRGSASNAATSGASPLEEMNSTISVTVVKAGDTKFIRGQSIMNSTKWVMSAGGVSKTPVYDSNDTKFDHDIEIVGAQSTISKVEELTPWHGTKYVYKFGQATNPGEVYLAHAVLHNGDTVISKTAGTHTAAGRNISGPSSIAYALNKQGWLASRAMGQLNDSDINTLSPVDDALLVCTQAPIKNSSMRTLSIYETNVTDSVKEAGANSASAISDVGITFMMQCITNYGIILTAMTGLVVDGPVERPENNETYHGPGTFVLLDYFDGGIHYTLDKEYNVNMSKAQYLYGVSLIDEEISISAKVR